MIGRLSKCDGDVLDGAARKMNFSHHFLVRHYQEQFSSRKSSCLQNSRSYTVFIYLQILQRKFIVAQPRSLQKLEVGKRSF